MWYTSSDFAAQDSAKTWKVDQATVSGLYLVYSQYNIFRIIVVMAALSHP